MGKIDIIQSIEVKANTEKAWDIVGPNFLNIADWADGIFKSWNNQSAEQNFKDAPAGGRYCDFGSQGIFDERIIHFDGAKYEITWSATGEKLPKFVSGLQNALKVEEIDGNTCRITTNISANANGPLGFLLGNMVKRNFSKLANGFLDNWKNYAESGQVSEKKQQELTKNKK